MQMQEVFDLLGRKAEDKVTGYTGVITSISFDLYGCVQAVVTPLVDKDGKRRDGCWYDVSRLTVDRIKDPVMERPPFLPSSRIEVPVDKGPAEKPLP